jgi:UDP-N-acetylglucosamine/UDP-N-acetylgalactosamine diphosphorylase
MKEMMVGSVAPVGPVGRWGAAPPQALLERMKDYGQEGAFALWDELSPEDRDLLVRDIEVSPMSPRSRLFGDQDFARSRRGVKIWSCIARWNCRQRF